jgi:hypothetical protein
VLKKAQQPAGHGVLALGLSDTADFAVLLFAEASDVEVAMDVAWCAAQDWDEDCAAAAEALAAELLRDMASAQAPSSA